MVCCCCFCFLSSSRFSVNAATRSFRILLDYCKFKTPWSPEPVGGPVRPSSPPAQFSLKTIFLEYHACYHELECFAKRLVCYLQGQGHREGSFNQIWQYLLNCWSFLLPNLIGLYFIMCRSVLCKNGIVMVKVTVKFHNFIESLWILYYLYHWSLCHQTTVKPL